MFHTQTFSELRELINELYINTEITFILLVDNHEDIAYIYKGKGNIQELKRTEIPNILKIYEARNRSNLFLTIEDIRMTMPMKDISTMN